MPDDLLPPIDAALWQRVNQKMIAKALREFIYEEVLEAKSLDAAKNSWQSTVGNTATYTFKGKKSHWGDLQIDHASIERNGAKADDALLFFADLQTVLESDPLTWSTFLIELQNTLLADLGQAHKLARQKFCTLEAAIAGHPKLIANFGRLGWGYADMALYGTESENPIQFFWLAIAKSSLTCVGNIEDGETLLAYSTNEAERERLQKYCPAAPDFLLVPVHPWQWQHWIVPHFLALMQKGEIVPLGQGGDFYQPQMSLRTFPTSPIRKNPTLNWRFQS